MLQILSDWMIMILEVMIQVWLNFSSTSISNSIVQTKLKKNWFALDWMKE